MTLANAYGDAGISTTGGYIFTAVVMALLITWVVSIWVKNYGPKAKARQAAEEEARRHPQVHPPAPVA